MKTLKKRKTKLKTRPLMATFAVLLTLLIAPMFFKEKKQPVVSMAETQYIELLTSQLKAKYGFEFEVVKITEAYEENTHTVYIQAGDDWSTNFVATFNSSTRLFDDNYTTRVMESRLSEFITNKMKEKSIDVVAHVHFNFILMAERDSSETLELRDYIEQFGVIGIDVLLYAEEPGTDIEGFSDSLLLCMTQIGEYTEVPVKFKTYFFSEDKFEASAMQLDAADLSGVNPFSYMPTAEVFITVDSAVADMTSFELSNILKQ